MNIASFVSSNQLRSDFSKKLSEMYKNEVPLYGDLISLTQHINHEFLANNPSLKKTLIHNNEYERLSDERHGAIRVGTPQELSQLRRLFALYGMYPVSYYDLAPAGIPVHSTAFRAINQSDLQISPFRLFTSLLRLDLITDEALKQKAVDLLNKRKIISDELLSLIEKAETEGGIQKSDSVTFVNLTVEIFKWHDKATVDEDTYTLLNKQHRLIADVVSFKGPHINHLTPRTLDIDQVQHLMPTKGIKPKLIIEGPPKRQCPILLRQTSFHALEEAIEFIDRDSDKTLKGAHTARFGEIEARGIALTPKGRQLYDTLLNQVLTQFPGEIKSSSVADYINKLEETFKAFPDDYPTLINQQLAWFRFYPNPQFVLQIDHKGQPYLLSELIANGVVNYSPIVYEDFLPVSAAGIFRSNLGDDKQIDYEPTLSKQAFEKALGCEVLDEMILYSKIQQDSINQCEKQLGIEIII